MGQKSRGPSKCPEKWLIKLLSRKKNTHALSLNFQPFSHLVKQAPYSLALRYWDLSNPFLYILVQCTYVYAYAFMQICLCSYINTVEFIQFSRKGQMSVLAMADLKVTSTNDLFV